MPEITVLLQLGQAIIAAMLASSYGIVLRHIHNPIVSAATLGGLFGAVAVLCMVLPIEVADGVIVDLRNLFIGLSFAYFGGLGGAVTLAMAVAARLVIGGDGALSGITGMSLAGGAGYAWRLWVQPRLGRSTLSHLVLGGMITLSLAGALITPQPFRSEIIFGLGPTLFLFYLLGSLMLAGLLAREVKLLEQAEALVLAAQTDPLTQLPNRRGLQVFLERQALHRPLSGGMAMICIDIDRFKQINDTYGHSIGDEVLREVTRRIGQALRPGDHLARHGGDEFIAILTGLSAAQSLASAERCRSAVSATEVRAGAAAIPVTISVGLHWVPRFDSFDALFSKADAALYSAKSDGRNLVRPAPLAA
jgi:diguanylate cyclase